MRLNTAVTSQLPAGSAPYQAPHDFPYASRVSLHKIKINAPALKDVLKLMALYMHTLFVPFK
jgi:hypothetical protein